MDGFFLNVFKPKGISSFKALSELKRKFNTKKVGHMGTLDPLAEGVLPVALNQATKLIPYVQDEPKVYEVEVLFGFETPTFDMEGLDLGAESLGQRVAGLELNAIEKCLTKFEGEISQVPPIFSSVKIDGKRAYDLARKGQIDESALKSRTVKVYHCEILEFKNPILKLRLEVSKGFYVRSLVRDLGKCLNLPTVMFSLVRTRVGCFKIEDAKLPAESLEYTAELSELFKNFERYDLNDVEFEKLRHGVPIEIKQHADLIYAFKNGDFTSILQKSSDSLTYKIVKNFI